MSVAKIIEISSQSPTSFDDAIRALALAGKRVRCVELTGEWADVRDPEILAQLNAKPAED